jgi:hypothetical protein
VPGHRVHRDQRAGPAPDQRRAHPADNRGRGGRRRGWPFWPATGPARPGTFSPAARPSPSPSGTSRDPVALVAPRSAESPGCPNCAAR